MQPVFSDASNSTHEPRANAEIEGAIDASDTDAIIRQGGQAIEAAGNDLGRAASGELLDVDMDTARQRMRDCQSALLSLGYSLGDHDDPVDGVNGMADAGTVEAVKQFQDDNDLDLTGVVDRDTYEELMRSFEQAMSMRAGVQVEDDFMHLHSGEAMQQTADISGAPTLEDELDVLDDSEQTALRLRDELRELGDADETMRDL